MILQWDREGPAPGRRASKLLQFPIEAAANHHDPVCNDPLHLTEEAAPIELMEAELPVPGCFRERVELIEAVPQNLDLVGGGHEATTRAAF